MKPKDAMLLKGPLLLFGLILFLGGLLLLLVGAFLLHSATVPFMPSYLPGWLFWSSLPVGALPVVMLLDLTGPDAGLGLEVALRRLLWLMPLAAILMFPVLAWPEPLFGWARGNGFSAPFGKVWMSEFAIVARGIIYFILWTFLALLFLRPPAPKDIGRRRGLAGIGLCIYFITATMASVDWAMVVEPGWHSSLFGLLLMSMQAATAISVAVLIAGREWRVAMPEAAASFLLVVIVLMVLLQFLQFLVIWSADKPDDITWYLHRSNVGSVIGVWMSLMVGVVVPLAVLLVPQGRRHPVVLPLMAMLVLVSQAMDMLWLITPSIRHGFTVTGMDVLQMGGIGGLMLGAMFLIGVPAVKTKPHG